MVIDQRRDHSFRVPRPDLSDALSTPNACNACHTDKSSQWASAAIEAWHAPDEKGFQTYGRFPRHLDQCERGAVAARDSRGEWHDAGIRPRRRVE